MLRFAAADISLSESIKETLSSEAKAFPTTVLPEPIIPTITTVLLSDIYLIPCFKIN
jgi:hypothetical protein